MINIWGADHHGYTPRLKGAITSLGYDSDSLIVVLVQFASLIMNKKKVSMSTRKGLFKTLEELIKDVGVDATRFFYLMRKADQTLEFDIDLAKEGKFEKSCLLHSICSCQIIECYQSVRYW